MSTFNALFEELLEKKQIELALDFSDSESLRVSLVRRWNGYKEKMDALGFLSEDLKHLSLSRERVPVEEAGVSRVFTRFILKSRTPVRTYTILSTSSNTSSSTSNEDKQ